MVKYEPSSAIQLSENINHFITVLETGIGLNATPPWMIRTKYLMVRHIVRCYRNECYKKNVFP